MHYQSYDGEEFEPRIIPKPTTKLDVSLLPTIVHYCLNTYIQFEDIKYN